MSQLDTSSTLLASKTLRNALQPADRVFIALTILLSCNPDEIVTIAEAALEQNTLGMPLPTFSTPLSDARWWAERATLEEKKAYAFACFEAMGNKLQCDFIQFVTKGVSR